MSDIGVRARARVFGLTALDVGLDILIPLVAVGLLTELNIPVYLAFTVSAIVVGGKAALGPVDHWRWSRATAFVALMTVFGIVAVIVLAFVGVPAPLVATAGVAIIAIPLAVSLMRGCVDGIGLFVLVELVTGVLVTMISDDPRFLLVRPAVYTSVAGLYALVTCWMGRPLMLDASKPMAAAGDPLRAQAFENAWVRSARFRFIERAMTAGLGVVLLAEAVLRVGFVYGSANANANADIAETSLAAQIPAIVLIVLFLIVVRVLAVPRARLIVDSELDALRASSAVTQRLTDM